MTNSCNWFDILSPSRQRKLLASARDGLWIAVDGKRLLNFASNDYLALSTHPKVCAAAKKAIDKSGLGSGASRLVSGDSPLLHELEHKLAAWKGFEACLVLGSGMLANLGLIQALADRHTHIFSDKLNHASLVDGARLSGAKVHRYPHLDLDNLESQLQKYPADKRIMVSDGVFSMDGDKADVSRLLKLAQAYDALLIVDDAHGTGTVGEQGKGLVVEAGVSGHECLLEVGTLGKAFGSYGAYVLGSSAMIEGLRQRMRTFIFSTALPESVIAGALAALDEMQITDVVKKLHNNISYFLAQAKALPLMPSNTAIQPLLLGSDEAALQAASHLREQGYFVPAIRPPTVPEGAARLRITLSAGHDERDIDGLIRALSNRV